MITRLAIVKTTSGILAGASWIILYRAVRTRKGIFTSCSYRAEKHAPETTQPVIPGGVDNTKKQRRDDPENVRSED